MRIPTRLSPTVVIACAHGAAVVLSVAVAAYIMTQPPSLWNEAMTIINGITIGINLMLAMFSSRRRLLRDDLQTLRADIAVATPTVHRMIAVSGSGSPHEIAQAIADAIEADLSGANGDYPDYPRKRLN